MSFGDDKTTLRDFAKAFVPGSRPQLVMEIFLAENPDKADELMPAMEVGLLAAKIVKERTQ